MNCGNCSHKVGKGAKFCPSCGTPVVYEKEEIKAEPAQDINTSNMHDSSSVIDKPVNDIPYGLKIFSNISRIIICVLLCICILLEFDIVIVRKLINKETVNSIVAEIKFSDLKVGRMLDQDEDVELAEFIYDNMAPEAREQYGLKESTIEKLLDSESTKMIISDYLDMFVDYAVDGTYFRITPADLVSSLKNKSEKISRILGYTLTEDDYHDMLRDIEQYGGFEEISSSNMTDEETAVVDMVRNIISARTEIMLAVIIVLMLLALIALDVLVRYPGICFSLSGLIPSVVLVVEQLLVVLLIPGIIYDNVGLPETLTSALVSHISDGCFNIWIVCGLASIVLLLVTILCRILLKKYRNSVK